LDAWRLTCTARIRVTGATASRPWVSTCRLRSMPARHVRTPASLMRAGPEGPATMRRTGCSHASGRRTG